MKFEPGIYEGVSYEEYAEIEAYRSHDLTTVIDCPYTWKYQLPLKETPALIEGRVQHSVFLELDKFEDEYVIEPKVDRRTKIGKAEYEDFLSGLGDRTPVKREMLDICLERREIVREFIPSEDDKVECTVLFHWREHPFKARFDWYDGINVWDLKTCRDASPRGFRGAINSFNYHMQAALYLDACKALGMRGDGFFFLAQEKAHPYPYAVYTLSGEAMEYGRSRNEQALHTLLACKENDRFEPYNLDGVQIVELSDLY